MNVLLSVSAILISVLAIVINQWVTFLPGLGIGFQYHRRRVQIAVGLLALVMATAAYLYNPTTAQLIVLGVVILLTPLSGFNHASKALVAVDRPQQVEAKAAGWPDEALVIGYTGERIACAWTLETLIPHHLVNDVVGGTPVLVAW